LKIKRQIRSGLRLLLAVLAALLFSAGASDAQDGTWWGSSHWFDWSDFRGSANGRLFFARLSSGSITRDGKEYDFKSSPYFFNTDPKIIREMWFELYVDRLGIRVHVQDHQFQSSHQNTLFGISDLDFGSLRLGLDLDVIRYPFFRAGFDFDYNMEAVKFEDNRTNNTTVVYSGAHPMTVGIHATAIPGRIREIPIIIEARVRGPVPFYKSSPDVKLVDWEVAGGLRPSIWQTSLYGHTTFAFSVEGGFRSLQINMDANPDVSGNSQASIKSHWQGAFLQLGVSF
jgi:hypothetical protein